MNGRGQYGAPSGQTHDQPSPKDGSVLITLGILGAVAFGGFLFLRDSPEERKEWKQYEDLDRRVSEALKRGKSR